jgi:hypothetical protein
MNRNFLTILAQKHYGLQVYAAVPPSDKMDKQRYH